MSFVDWLSDSRFFFCPLSPFIFNPFSSAYCSKQPAEQGEDGIDSCVKNKVSLPFLQPDTANHRRV